MKSFSIAYREALPHGVMVGIRLPPPDAPISDEVRKRLFASEREILDTLKGHQRGQFVGGRLAAHAATKNLGRNPKPILKDAWGAPTMGTDVSLSITHKSNIAFSLVARSNFGSLGVDYEPLEPSRIQVAKKVLLPEEMAEVEALEEENRWNSILIRFCLKEAIYKSLAPKLQRYIGFDEAKVTPNIDGSVVLRLQLKDSAAPYRIEGRFRWIDQGVLATVRTKWEKSP